MSAKLASCGICDTVLRSAFDHPKFRGLAQSLGVPRYRVVGILECLWHFTARFAPQGDIGRFTNQQIGEWLEFEDHDNLVESLCKNGWIDRCQEKRLVVHDWGQHADEAVKKKLKRNGLKACVAVSTCLDISASTGDTCLDTNRPPEPEPEPEPENKPFVTSGKVTRKKHAYPDWFKAIWDVYPKRNGKRLGKNEALPRCKALLNNGVSEAELLLATQNYARFCEEKDQFPKDAKRFFQKDGYWRDFLNGSSDEGNVIEHEGKKYERLPDGRLELISG